MEKEEENIFLIGKVRFVHPKLLGKTQKSWGENFNSNFNNFWNRKAVGIQTNLQLRKLYQKLWFLKGVKTTFLPLPSGDRSGGGPLSSPGRVYHLHYLLSQVQDRHTLFYISQPHCCK
jgi:hypothetical protein